MTFNVPDRQEAMIWGTDINVNAAMENFRDFIRNFREAVGEPGEDSDDDDDEVQQPMAPYMQLLHEIQRSSVYSIDINCRHLWNHLRTRELYTQLLHYPQDVVPIMDLVVTQEFIELFDEASLQGKRIQVCLYALARYRLRIS